MNRFDQLDIAELQQLLVAVTAAEGLEIIDAGPGNLLPRLRQELGVALDDRLHQEDA